MPLKSTADSSTIAPGDSPPGSAPSTSAPSYPSQRTGNMLARPLKTLIRAFFGPVGAWKLKKHSLRAAVDFRSRLQAALEHVSPDTLAYDQAPIFLLSAGWRSGSTLLQRMLMEHNRNAIIWGEPFDHSNIHECMANQFRAFTSQWPFERYFLSTKRGSNLSDEWVANLYPDVDYLLNAHRKFYDELFGEAARAAGRNNWGLKEVRLTIDHAMYFRALYPQCKILLLYRNPHEAYLSYRRVEAGWFLHWPDDLVKTAYAYGRHWADSTRGFLEGHEKVNGLLIRYEDLDNPTDVERLSSYLGWPVSRSSNLQRRDLAERRGKGVTLPRLDKAILNFATGKTRKDAGY